MTDPYGKIVAGEPYPRSAMVRNDWMDMLRWWKQHQRTGGGPLKQVVRQTGIVFCKNVSGGDLTRFAALAVTDVFPDPGDNETTFKNGPVLHGNTPDASTEPGNFVVLLAPAKVDKIVPACASGVCVAKVDINDADDVTCGVGTSTVLQSGKQGAQILWKESGTGLLWAVIRIGGLPGYDRCTCLLKGALDSGDSTTTVDNVKIIRGTSPLSDPTSTSEELTVYNTHSWDGDDNALARIEWNVTEERWEFYQVTCPA